MKDMVNNYEKKEYICYEDLQGGGFHEGDTRTAEGWREWAMMSFWITKVRRYGNNTK